MTHDDPSTEPVESALQASAALTSATRRGAPLVLIGHLASQLIGLGTLAILFRLLGPAEFGLLAAVLPAVMLPRMAATLGPGIAVMQRRDLSQMQLSVLFWLQVFAGIAATATTVVICWLQARYYHEPALFAVGVVLAGGTLFAALGNQHQALLERDLRFGAASLLRLVAQLIACIAAIGWAVYRPDVWALVIQHVLELAVLFVGSWLLLKWWPAWPKRPWHVRELLNFSVAYSVSSLVHFLAQNLEKILLPFFFGVTGNRALGLYSQAFGLMIKPVYLLTSPLTGVMVSSLAKAEPGSELYSRLTARFFRMSALGLFPCAIGLSLVSNDLMLLVGGGAWRDGGELLGWLAPAIISIGLQNLAIFVLASRGRGRELLIASFWLLALLLQGAAIGMYVGGHNAGNESLNASLGLAIAFTLVHLFVWCLPFLWFALQIVQVSPWQIARQLWPAARSAAVMGLVVIVTRELVFKQDNYSPSVRLATLVLTGVVTYLLIAAREILQLRREWAN
ncbi:oligosaccharide flippase family protein [Anatilimnocola floriformis]|uniref:oligosaccharide flippase family protein n=1 Tax=Anatilimnocola floriformis TaxID=2948575 RepID=UPI0020C5453E|nr:oligosaccharide flippase family protein [Anatilimnocola floriformis]